VLPGVLIALGITLTMSATASAGGTAPKVIPAGSVGEPIIADFNGDGIPDEAILGQVGNTNQCTVTVLQGQPDGSFVAQPPHTYTSLERFAPFCPDSGAAVKLGGHRRFDLVTGFSQGESDFMILTNFQAVSIMPGILQPSFIRAGAIDAAGRQDIIAGTNQTNQVRTFVNTAQGTLTPGVRVCTDVIGSSIPRYTFADFNGDHGQDLLIATRCPDAPNPAAVQVVFGNGQAPTTLISSPDPATRYVPFLIDINLDGVPDVGVVATANGTTTAAYFLNDGHGNFTQITLP
jgi:hypothetical protein